MSKLSKILTRLKNVEQALLVLGKTEKIKCSECHRERFQVEYHSNMLSDSVKRKICKICVNRINRERNASTNIESNKS